MINTIYPCPISFFPWIHFAPKPFCPPHYFAPWKSFNDLHYLPMSHFIFHPGSILPPYQFAPVSFCPHIILPPYHCGPVSFCPPYHFAPWESFNDLLYLPMFHISFSSGFILPPYHFAPGLDSWGIRINM